MTDDYEVNCTNENCGMLVHPDEINRYGTCCYCNGKNMKRKGKEYFIKGRPGCYWEFG